MFRRGSAPFFFFWLTRLLVGFYRNPLLLPVVRSLPTPFFFPPAWVSFRGAPPADNTTVVSLVTRALTRLGANGLTPHRVRSVLFEDTTNRVVLFLVRVDFVFCRCPRGAICFVFRVTSIRFKRVIT